MFISEIKSGTHIIDGRRFTENTVTNQFNKARVSITTVYMDKKPILKKYIFDSDNKIRHFWKNLKTKTVNEFSDHKLDLRG